MSAINIKRFVDINIIQHTASVINSTRDTVVLFTSEIVTPASGFDTIFSSMAQYLANDSVKDLTVTTNYAQMYFNNGGNKLRIIQIASDAGLADAIIALDNNYIVCALAKINNYTTVQPVALARENNSNVYGINQKILLANVSTFNELTPTANLAVKYSTVVGAEMTIAAYLSNINVYGINTIQDYAFTMENIIPETSNDTVLGNVMSNNLNVNMYLAGAVRNLGGNLTNGEDLVNTYTLIVLHQTLTDKVLELLTTKIKGSMALGALNTVISEELSKYITCGYLTTDKIWTEPSLYINYNNISYPIIEQSTPISKGYNITILPLTSLTAEDISLRKAPLIYVILADSYGIRKITINGEVV